MLPDGSMGGGRPSLKPGLDSPGQFMEGDNKPKVRISKAQMDPDMV
jgi:hypothetical protein